MHSSYYWLYDDTLFNKEGQPEHVTVRALMAKEAYTHSFREHNSPILVTFSSILPDFAFRNDTVFRLNTRKDIHRWNCVVIGGPFLYQTSDTITFPVNDTLMPWPFEVVTPAGSFTNNYVRKSSLITYIFNRDVGLLYFSQKERNGQTGELWLKRSVWLKEAVLDQTRGRRGQED